MSDYTNEEAGDDGLVAPVVRRCLRCHTPTAQCSCPVGKLRIPSSHQVQHKSSPVQCFTLLSSDMWVRICDWAGNARGCTALSRVCRNLWRLLHRRHQCVGRLSEHRHQLNVVTESCQQQMRSAEIELYAENLGTNWPSRVLKHYTTLFNLHLKPSYSEEIKTADRRITGPALAEVLATLTDSTTLCSLTLDLSGGNVMGDTGAQALAALKDSTTLRSLTLDLSRNKSSSLFLHSFSAHAMAAPKDPTTLCSLTLKLSDNEMGNAGAQALATLKDSTTLLNFTPSH